MDHSQYFQEMRHVRQGSTGNNYVTNQSKQQGSLSPSNRRSSTTAFESKSFSRDSSPQTSRRYSNPINHGSSGIARSSSCTRSRSPSDPQYPGLGSTRRFSQPAASFGNLFGTDEDEGREKRTLAMKEKESYSSLTYLPEVRAYLKFMEDDIPIPHRSKSFNGRNSSRRSSYNRRNRRSKSRTRTPTPTPFDDDNDSSFEQNVFEPIEFTSKAYGRYLTPERLSVDSCGNTNRSKSFDASVSPESMSRFNHQQSRMSEDSYQPQKSPSQGNEVVQTQRRRSGSLIRTTFI